MTSIIVMALSQKEAQKIGVKTYFSGVKCSHGHISERYSSNNSCCECTAIMNRERQEKKISDRESSLLTTYSWLPRKKSQAKKQNVTQYYTGKLCARGHDAPRMVCNSSCVECQKEMSRNWYNKNYERLNEEAKIRANAYYENNKDHAKKKSKEYRDSHKEYYASYLIEYNEKNKDRLALKRKEYYLSNKHKRSPDLVAKRRARKLLAMPAWADLKKIREIYREAKKRNSVGDIKWHVDHVIPLQGRTVCGLHVHYNLNIIPASENCRKHNKLMEDML